MTDHAKVSTARRQTRRQLLTGGTGALAAILAAEAIAPAPAQAGVDGDVVLGEQNSTDRTTSIDNLTTHFPVLSCTSNTGIGVSGFSSQGVAIDGDSKTGDGVRGNSDHAGRGVFGTSNTGDGVRGESSAGIGVHGIGDGVSTGVQGVSTRGTGVAGFSDTGTAVFALNASRAQSAVSGQNLGSGPGVSGFSKDGPGVRATGKTALSVQGKAVFSRSGTVTVAAGHSSVTKSGVALTSASLVLVTLQQHVAGVHVLAAVPNVTGNSFKVFLSKAVPTATKVAWFIVN